MNRFQKLQVGLQVGFLVDCETLHDLVLDSQHHLPTLEVTVEAAQKSEVRLDMTLWIPKLILGSKCHRLILPYKRAGILYRTHLGLAAVQVCEQRPSGADVTNHKNKKSFEGFGFLLKKKFSLVGLAHVFGKRTNKKITCHCFPSVSRRHNL